MKIAPFSNANERFQTRFRAARNERALNWRATEHATSWVGYFECYDPLVGHQRVYSVIAPTALERWFAARIGLTWVPRGEADRA